jgi:hypothetical protein
MRSRKHFHLSRLTFAKTLLQLKLELSENSTRRPVGFGEYVSYAFANQDV